MCLIHATIDIRSLFGWWLRFSIHLFGRDLVGDGGGRSYDVSRGLPDDLRVMRFKPFGVERVGDGESELGGAVVPLE